MTPSITTDKWNPDFIVRSIQGAYWNNGYTEPQILSALENSIVVSAYDGYRQIGFVRIVSDHSIFSSITDVFVDEAYRGQGVGSAMMDAVVKLPEVAKTLCILQARPLATLFYMKWDFVVIDHRSGIMQRNPT